MVDIPRNSPGLSTTVLLQQFNAASRISGKNLEIELSSGGKNNGLCERTPNLLGFLEGSRALIEDKVHIVNNTKINNRSQEQIQFVQLCQNIALQAGQRLSNVRTRTALDDVTFTGWCTQQLANIAASGNRAMQDGTYSCANGTMYKAPIDATAILTPLPSGTGPTFDYAVGAFNSHDFRTASSQTFTDTFDVKHTGVEGLIRFLRICQGGNPSNENDPTWAFANDLLVKHVNPQLSYALKQVSSLGEAAQSAADEIKNKQQEIAKDMQSLGFVSPEQIVQMKFEEATKAKIQESTLISNLKQTRDFLEKMDSIF